MSSKRRSRGKRSKSVKSVARRSWKDQTIDRAIGIVKFYENIRLNSGPVHSLVIDGHWIVDPPFRPTDWQSMSVKEYPF